METNTMNVMFDGSDETDKDDKDDECIKDDYYRQIYIRRNSMDR